MISELQIYDINDLMEIFKFKKTKMTQILTMGILPAVKIGGQWRITNKQLEKWFDENQGTKIDI